MPTPAQPAFDLTPERVLELLEAGEVDLIDVRETYERRAGYIGGSRHLRLAELSASAGSLDRARPLVFQCRVGARSGMAAHAFRRAGYDAYNLRGGIAAWAERGLPLEPVGGFVADH
jgi:rhodanese-related sulfurtransferase